MNLYKTLAYAVFMAFLCIAPIFASAQDTAARLIDIPDVENDVSGNTLTSALRDIFSDNGHIVFGQDDMNDAASQVGVSGSYWKDPDLIKKVNKSVRHDAVVYFIHQRSSGGSKLVFNIYNAYTGELIQDFEIKLAKKNKISKTEKLKVRKAVETIIGDINPDDYPSDIMVKIISTPAGAEVSRNGVILGVTPLETPIMQQDTEALEQWVLTYPGRDSVTQNVSVARGATYNVNIPDVYTSGDSGFIGKIKSGFGRPILKVGVNASPGIRRLKSEDKNGGDVISYRSAVYPVFSFDLDFFPTPLFSDIDYLQGLGISFGVGYGFHDTSLQVDNSDTECTVVDGSENGVFTLKCGTNYIRANVDVVYKLLLQKRDGKLDPNGMAVDFILGYAYTGYKLQENKLYRGSVAHAFQLGARYSTPIAIDDFRFSANFLFNINGNNGGIDYLKYWGTSIASSVGLSTGLDFSYDIYKGFFVHAGYQFSYNLTKYSGNGCLDKNCSSPSNAEVQEFYHEIMLGLGYALY